MRCSCSTATSASAATRWRCWPAPPGWPRPGGAVAVEVEPPGRPSTALTVRIEAPDARPGPWFPWARVGADGIAAVAAAAGLAVAALDAGGRPLVRPVGGAVTAGALVLSDVACGRHGER